MSTATMVVAGAHAADLPVRKAAPVDYVRVCDWTGTGYFYIPGTDTCLKIGGAVRAEGAFISASRIFRPDQVLSNGTPYLVIGRNQDQSGFFARGQLTTDIRTQTAYGTLRSFIAIQADRYQGLYQGGGLAGGANSFANQGGNLTYLDKGFIQFAGITAGRVQSFFDFYADTWNYEGIANSDLSNEVFAYTYNGNGGFSATFSLEDHNVRNDGIGAISGGRFAVVGAPQYGGETVPDLVGQIRVDQAWGAAQLSAAYHEINTISGPFNGTNGQGYAKKDDDGFAVQAGINLKLPMLAAGDSMWLQGAYQNGAYLYQDSVAYANQGFNSRLLGGFQHVDRDAIAIGVPGSTTGAYTLEKSRGFSVMAAINHYFTPNFHDVIFASYEESSYGRAKNIDWTLGGLGNASQYRIGNQFLWDPVKNLEFGVEFFYAHLDQTLAHNPNQAATALPVGISKNPDAFEARLRVERDF
jgi:hypothetical protein